MCLKEEFQVVRANQYIPSQYLNKTRNEKALFINQVESTKTKLALTESSLFEAKTYEVKLVDEVSKKGGIKFLILLGIFNSNGI